MATPTAIYRASMAGQHVHVCAACEGLGPVPDSEPLLEEEVRELEPTDTCFLCSQPLLQAGRLRLALERLGFTFEIEADSSAWLKVQREAHGVLAVRTLVCREGPQAPFDDEDREVVLLIRRYPLDALAPISAGMEKDEVTFANLSTAVEQLALEASRRFTRPALVV